MAFAGLGTLVLASVAIPVLQAGRNAGDARAPHAKAFFTVAPGVRAKGVVAHRRRNGPREA